jgi:hypothetical protein
MDIITLCSCCAAGILVIFGIALVLGQRRMRQVEGLMRQLAERHGASFTPGNILFNPCITFREGELELRLYAALGGRDDPSHTELHLDLPDLPLVETQNLAPLPAPQPHLHIRPHSFKTRLTVTLGAKPYLTGDQAFDAEFDVRGTPEALLQHCLVPDVRQCLLELKANRPAARLARQSPLRHRLSALRNPKTAATPPPALQYRFYTAGLPTDIAAWEPRLAAARLLLSRILERPPERTPALSI